MNVSPCPIRLVAQRAQLLLAVMLLILAACATGDEVDGSNVWRAAELPTLGDGPIRVILIRGVVEPLERDLFGRPERVAIVFISSQGFLVQNAIEDVAAGEKLKDHVGENVTVRGALLVKADGRPTLLVDAFAVNGSRVEGLEN